MDNDSQIRILHFRFFALYFTVFFYICSVIFVFEQNILIAN